jgi:uracil-DNA glycosylase
VVFLAWGSPAQKRCERITGARHLVLKSVHPSPLSAHRGFFDCGHFKKANDWLRSRYGPEGVIDWDLSAPNPIKAPPPDVQEPVKATADQTIPNEDGPVTELPTRTNGEPATKPDDFFAGEDDEDAMAVLEEIEKLESEK